MGEGVDIYAGEDPHALPMFNRAEVARWLAVPYSTLRRWSPKRDLSFLELYELSERRIMGDGGEFEVGEDGRPIVYYPVWPYITVNPRVAFGVPTIAGTGIKARVVASRIASGETAKEVAWDYDIDERAVEAAIKFEGVSPHPPAPRH